MVHNGIEYGLMAAYAEGLNIITNADAGKRQREMDAETAPLENPEYYQYEIDTTEVAEVWRRGSVVGSWLLDLTAEALYASPTLDEFAGRVSDSGEGRWTSTAAIDVGVPAPVLTTALYSRFASRGLDELRRTSSSRRCARSSADTTRRRREPRRSSRCFRDAEAVAERGAAYVAEHARAAVADHGRFTFAVSGGHTPWAMFAAPRREDMPWENVTIYQVDERVAPDGDPDRNLTHLQREPAARRRRRRPADARRSDRPRGRGRRVRGALPGAVRPHPPRARPGRAHGVARPGRPGARRRPDRDVALTGEYQGRSRMTLTYPTLDRARQVLWLVTGEDKVDALHASAPVIARFQEAASRRRAR